MSPQIVNLLQFGSSSYPEYNLILNIIVMPPKLIPDYQGSRSQTQNYKHFTYPFDISLFCEADQSVIRSQYKQHCVNWRTLLFLSADQII